MTYRKRIRIARNWTAVLENSVLGLTAAALLFIVASAARPNIMRYRASRIDPAIIADLINNGSRIGSATASVTIIEFADYECQFCARVAPVIERVVKESKGQVALVYYHFPLSFHEYAKPAAAASLCASEQGKFETMHRTLYVLQDQLGMIEWSEVARRAEVTDGLAFEQCIKSPRVAATIDSHRKLGASLKVQGTPTIFVGNRRVSGTPSYEELLEAIRLAL